MGLGGGMQVRLCLRGFDGIGVGGILLQVDPAGWGGIFHGVVWVGICVLWGRGSQGGGMLGVGCE